MVLRVCKHCQKEFHTQDRGPGRGIYCSYTCRGLANQGVNNCKWTGGFVRIDGYKCLSVAGGAIFEHRHLMEQHLGRKLTEEEIIHHIDGNKLNNTLSNLQLMTRSTHAILHLTDPLKHIDLECPVCGKHFKRYLHLIKRRTPGCNRSCAAKLRRRREKKQRETELTLTKE